MSKYEPLWDYLVNNKKAIPFKSLTESVNLDKITEMVDEEYIPLRFLAVLELPETTESEDETEWED